MVISTLLNLLLFLAILELTVLLDFIVVMGRYCHLTEFLDFIVVIVHLDYLVIIALLVVIGFPVITAVMYFNHRLVVTGFTVIKNLLVFIDFIGFLGLIGYLAVTEVIIVE